MDQPPAAAPSPTVTPQLVEQERTAVRLALQENIITGLVQDLAHARAHLVVAHAELARLRPLVADAAPADAPPPAAP